MDMLGFTLQTKKAIYMVKSIFPRSLVGRIASLEHRLVELESRLVDIQAEYADSARELAEMRVFVHRLADWGLKASDTGSWFGVCNSVGWPAITSNAHRVVRREDIVLHVLLHRCAFTPYCSLDGVSYSDLPTSYRPYL